MEGDIGFNVHRVHHNDSVPLYVTKVCNIGLGHNESVCDSLHEEANDSVEDEVQKSVNHFKIYGGFISAIPGLVYSIFAGALSDKYGRKPLLYLPLTGHLIASVLQILHYFFIRSASRVLLMDGSFAIHPRVTFLNVCTENFQCFSSTLTGCTTSWAATPSTTWAPTALARTPLTTQAGQRGLTCHSQDKRVSNQQCYNLFEHRLGRLDGAELIGLLIGTSLSPVVKRHWGNLGNYWCQTALVGFTVIYLRFFVKESKGQNKDEQSTDQDPEAEKKVHYYQSSG